MKKKRAGNDPSLIDLKAASTATRREAYESGTMRRQDIDFAFGVIVGALLGFVLLCVVNFSSVFVSVKEVQDWQDLIGALAGIAAAGLALLGIWWQVRHAQLLEDERRERDFFAARSLSSHALNELCAHQKTCFSILREACRDEVPEPFHGYPLKEPIPALTPTAMERLEKVLRFGTPEIQARIHELFGLLQVQQARGEIPTPSGAWVYWMMLDAMDIYVRAAMLFRWAHWRPGEKPVPVPNEPRVGDIQGTAHGVGYVKGLWPDLDELIAKRWRS